MTKKPRIIRMDETAPLHVYTFIGRSGDDPPDAVARAVAALRNWYQEQTPLYTITPMDLDAGALGVLSLLQFSTTAYMDGAECVFIITVFDTRRPRIRGD